jgi:class 3 adenylate cyclase/tetratricopeptide (TPR) repeat protein
MRCPRCQRENEAGANFCEECAAPLARTCRHCGRPLSAAARFCPECGQPTGVPAAAGPGPRAVAPEQASRPALEDERKHVTVLFADMKGSMELLADRDPEEARTILDPLLERMMHAVRRYEGTVNQVMGDGIMALFGAPVAHEDDGVRACYAALDMQTAVRRYADEAGRAHGIRPQIRVGLDSGEVVVRALSSDLHTDYTAVGQTAHLAARMEQLATPGTILMTGNTLELARGSVTVTPLGPLRVKGLEASVDVYELTGAGPLRSRLDAAAARGLTRFVGREAELERLRQAASRAAAGRGQVVAIVGEPGVGKSRLVWEVSQICRSQRWLVLQSASVSYGKAISYMPVVELLKRYFTIDDRDDPRSARDKMVRKVSALDPALEAMLPPLSSLLDLPTDDPDWQVLDSPQRRRRSLDAVKRLLLREAQVQPLLLVFEDLHWIDSETQALLDGLVDSVPAARLLLLVNYRPEYRHAWGGRAYYTQVGLDPLPSERAEELLGALLGPDVGLDALKRVLIERTEGNPFFLEESIRALTETGALLGERGAHRLARPLPSIQVPATVQAVLAARIDRLPPGDKALLHAASVVGKDVPLVLLRAVAELADAELQAALGRLQAAEFLYETAAFPDLEYTFKHALTHEVTYGSLLHDRRRALHGRIVDTIERLQDERLGQHVEQLAHHAVRGEVWAKAVRYLTQAAERAAAHSAHRAAVRYLEQALDALHRLPATAETTAQAIDVRFALRNSLFAVGEHGRIRVHLEEAHRLAEASQDEGRLAWAAVYMSNYYWREGDPARAIALGRHAHAAAENRHDLALTITSSFRLGQAYHAHGDYRRAVDVLRGTVDVLHGDLDRALFGLAGLPSVFCRAFLVWSLAELGDFDEGIRHAEDAIRIADAASQMYSRAMGRFVLGFLHLGHGRPERAARVLERGVALVESGEIFALRSMLLAAVGHARTLAGRPDEAIPLLEQSVDAAMFALSPQHPFPFLFLARAYLMAHRIDDSAHVGLRCLEVCRARREAGSEAWTLHMLGDIGLHRGSDDADAHYREALALAGERGMRPLVAHCHLGLGRLCRSAAERQRAHEHLAVAATMYREMDMRLWLEQAQAEMKALT